MRRAHVPPESEGETEAHGKYVACLAWHTMCPGLHMGGALCFSPNRLFSSMFQESRAQLKAASGHLWDTGGRVRVCLPRWPWPLGMEGTRDPKLGWSWPQAPPGVTTRVTQSKLLVPQGGSPTGSAPRVQSRGRGLVRDHFWLVAEGPGGLA